MCEIIVLWLFHAVFSGMAVYNVVIVCIVGTPVVTFVHEKQFEASFIITGICILFSTTSTLCIVFVPKVGFPEWSYKHECYSLKKNVIFRLSKRAGMNFFLLLSILITILFY